MAASRGEFSSRMGFILAAAGSAVGLGNIWGFPSQVAANGGAAFVLVYLLLAFLIAYPVLMTELAIGRFAKANTLAALEKLSRGPISRRASYLFGYLGVVVAGLILSFYGVIAGLMLGQCLESLLSLFGIETGLLSGTGASTFFTLLFMALTFAIVMRGVSSGIEAWSRRLMPMLIVLLLLLIAIVVSQAGAQQGLKAYLLPDFSKIWQGDLLLSAMGQVFFSLSLGVGTMLIYGSYVKQKESLPKLGAWVTLVDVAIAFLAGLLIIPAMYVAMNNGVQIYDSQGELLASSQLVFVVLPELFASLGVFGIVLSSLFFAMLVLASLTSSISMLEVPVATLSEQSGCSRRQAAILSLLVIASVSLLLIWQGDVLFGLAVSASTEFGQPLMGLVFCIYLGWLWQRHLLLSELQKGSPNIANSAFWRCWPNYVKYVCPLIILTIFFSSIAA
ncbi:sodium-dependent transporter [uncultured Pseudoteredinibacter sp.]|uniref:sodium-dependent transporter n=1 Tax=uncultured Pseudoteredinibacter sp. TaxID=1641701 RepID=UPI002624A98E|nr:sodium-dependent transporter [uncultured Pseudoteredinibacter sp.]